MPIRGKEKEEKRRKMKQARLIKNVIHKWLVKQTETQS